MVLIRAFTFVYSKRRERRRFDDPTEIDSMRRVGGRLRYATVWPYENKSKAQSDTNTVLGVGREGEEGKKKSSRLSAQLGGEL